MIPLRLRLLAIPLRIFFRLLYHQMAWCYDWVAAVVSLGQWTDWVRSVLPYVAGPCVLELGHGPGHLQIALKDRSRTSSSGSGGKTAFRVFGLDRSPQMGRQASARLLRSGCTPALVNGLAQALPYPSGIFYTVVSTFPSEYIFHRQTLAEVWRVLAPGGEFVVLPLAWITGRRPLERLAAWWFFVTGEAPRFHDKALDPLRKLGFIPRAEYIDLPSSRLLIVAARKP
jgi:ubiquinone/menaquinone biosynthesis C-methylase UbiE